MSELLNQSRLLRPAPLPTLVRALVPLLVIVGIAGAMHWVATPLVGPFYVNILANTGIAVMLAVSLNLVNGFTGQFSIGHAGFMAVGGYVGGIITYYGSLLLFGSAVVQESLLSWGSVLFVGGCLAGGIASGVVGYFVGLPALRLRGDYLAIVTLGFGEIVRVLVTQTGDVLNSADEVREAGVWRTITGVGGALGFGGVPWYNNLFWTFLFCGLTLLVCYRLKRSSTGRAFLSVREDEISAQAMGVHISQIKVRAFVISSFLAGLTGVIFAHQSGVSLNPNELNFNKSFEILIAVVLGGLGSISGAVMAAAIVTVLGEALKDPPSLVIWGAVVLVLAATLQQTIAAAEKGQRDRALRTLLIGVAVVGGLVVLGVLLGPWLWTMLGKQAEWLGKPVLWVSSVVFGAGSILAGKVLPLPAGAAGPGVRRLLLTGTLTIAALESARLLAGLYGVRLEEYRMIIYALLLIGMMLSRPQGLMGIHEIWDIGLLLRPQRGKRKA